MKGYILGCFFGVLMQTIDVGNIDIIKYDVYGFLSNPPRDQLIWGNATREEADQWIKWACEEENIYKLCIKVIKD